MHYAEPMLVVGARDVRNGDIEGAISVAVAPEPFGLAAEAIDTARPLLERRRVPREVVVDNVAALAVKVDAFLSDRGDDEDLRRIAPLAFPSSGGFRRKVRASTVPSPGRAKWKSQSIFI